MAKASEWAIRVAAWRASGQKATEFCSDKGYSQKSLLWWSSRLRRKGTPSASGDQVRLARVVRTAASSQAAGTPSIVVHVGRARVEVPAGADIAALGGVLEALSAWEGGQR